jgi:outer membrane receptor protein involved in Fe transport
MLRRRSISKVSLIATASAAAVVSSLTVSSAAFAQVPQPAQIEAVVVTGTSIRGVAPIGSNLVSIGREAVEKTAAINATELTNTVSAITTAGAAPVGENVFSYFAPSIHSLGGSASNTTLVIVDGLRMPGGGTQFGQTDPNIIPSSALQRVEVLADGASSVYGSDAVAGVVNYITRRSYEGLEVSGRVGKGKKWNSQDFNGIWGTNWDDGGVYIAGQYSYQSPLHNRSRDFLSMGDFRPVGGRNTQTFACSPATIRTTASGANVYLSPTATTTVANVADNAPCNPAVFGDTIQDNKRINGLVRVHQTFGNLTVTGTANYNYLRGVRDLPPGTLANITAFGPGSNRTGQINPFYRAPAGEPGAPQEIINWLALTPDGQYGTQAASNDTLFLYGTAEYEINDNWSAKLSNAFGRSRSSLVSNNTFCNSCGILALNGTTQTGGSLTASSASTGNIVALNTPLTAANALDVWSANGGATNASVLRNLYRDNVSNEHWNNYNQTKLETQGTLFQLPAGALRFAAGLEYMWVTQDVEQITTANLGSTLLGGTLFTPFNFERNVSSAYVEVVVPLVSESMGIPLMKSFDLNLSHRIDRYSDVGNTDNPKIAANWQVMDGLRLRGNYATAFVAPPLATIGVPEYGYRRNANGAAIAGTINVPVALYPEVRGVPGCATATVTCQIGTGINQGISRGYGAGLTARPQTGNSWSVGFDYNPPQVPGLTSSFTYWSNKFEGGMDRPEVSQYLYSSALHDRLHIFPTGASQAQINEFVNLSTGGLFTGAQPTTVYFFANNDLGNVINLNVEGIDFVVNYRRPTEEYGTFIVGAQGTYYQKFEQHFGDAPFSIAGSSGSNATFPAIQERYRFQLGWAGGPFSVDLFMNYTGEYRNWSNATVAPIIVSAAGVPVGGGDYVAANKIYDLHAEYDLPKNGVLSRSSVYLDVKNLLDDKPPFYSGNSGGIGVGGQGYNAYVSNPIGRIVSVGFRAKF